MDVGLGIPTIRSKHLIFNWSKAKQNPSDFPLRTLLSYEVSVATNCASCEVETQKYFFSQSTTSNCCKMATYYLILSTKGS